MPKPDKLRSRSSRPPARTLVVPRADPVQPVNVGALAEILGFRMHRVHAHLSQASAAALAERSLRPGEFSALAIIAATPGISQVALAREIGVDKAAIVTVVDDLEHWGWAVRRQSPDDRRRNSIQVTAKGERALAELVTTIKANESRVTSTLSTAELKRLFALLDRIYSACLNDT